jgi:hypothetical protein
MLHRCGSRNDPRIWWNRGCQTNRRRDEADCRDDDATVTLTQTVPVIDFYIVDGRQPTTGREGRG